MVDSEGESAGTFYACHVDGIQSLRCFSEETLLVWSRELAGIFLPSVF